MHTICLNSFLVLLLLVPWPDHGESRTDKETQNYIKAIRKEIFQNSGYDPMARPVLNYTQPIRVTIYMDINYIKQLDINTHVLESEGWIRLLWKDHNLVWSPSDYGDITDIRARVDEIFRPDITIINAVGSENVLRTTTHSDLIVWNTGEVSWMPALSMKTVCEIELSDWPFDQQTCIFRFASWTYDGSGVDIQNASDRIDLTSFVPNGEWEPMSSTAEHKKTYYYDEYYPEVIFSLVLQRSPTIYRYAIYWPVLCVIILNLMTLFLDVRNHLRFHLSGLSFFTLLIVLLYLASKLSFGSLGTPKLSESFYLCCLPAVITALTIMFTLKVIYLGQMILTVAITMLWSAFALNFSKSSFEVPSMVMSAIKPVQHFLVSDDIEAAQLTSNESDECKTSNHTTSAGLSRTNMVAIQIVDKLLFIIFLFLAIILHN